MGREGAREGGGGRPSAAASKLRRRGKERRPKESAGKNIPGRENSKREAEAGRGGTEEGWAWRECGERSGRRDWSHAGHADRVKG